MHFMCVAKLFDRDPDTNEVLWFAAPPLNQPRPRGPRHSLAYLQFIAAKRKKATAEGDNDNDNVDDDRNPSKRTRMIVTPTVTETMRQIVENMR